jgi:hypothetical protein
MLYLNIALFAIAAIIGLLILKNWLTSATTPRATVYAHGIFAAAGLVLLFIYFMRNGEQNIKTSFILFTVASVAGFYMFYQDLRGKFSPTWMAVVHGLVAVVGFVFLLMAVI